MISAVKRSPFLEIAAIAFPSFSSISTISVLNLNSTPFASKIFLI